MSFLFFLNYESGTKRQAKWYKFVPTFVWLLATQQFHSNRKNKVMGIFTIFEKFINSKYLVKN